MKDPKGNFKAYPTKSGKPSCGTCDHLRYVIYWSQAPGYQWTDYGCALIDSEKVVHTKEEIVYKGDPYETELPKNCPTGGAV